MTQVKRAMFPNVTGRDNRTPFVGHTQFPTEGSKSMTERLDHESKSKSEVGPAPLTTKLDKTSVIPMREVVPKMPTAMGSIPQIKQAEDRLRSDPLVQYLKKHAQQLESNVDAFIAKIPVKPLQSKESDFVGTPAADRMDEQDRLLKDLFKNYDSTSPSL